MARKSAKMKKKPTSRVKVGKVKIKRSKASERVLEGGRPGAIPGHRGSSRGSSSQGELQRAKGGPAGANQGGASRGAARMEPSHQRARIKQDKP